jgi:hypothetical protein
VSRQGERRQGKLLMNELRSPKLGLSNVRILEKKKKVRYTEREEKTLLDRKENCVQRNSW